MNHLKKLINIMFRVRVSCAVELYKPIAAVVGQQDNL